MPAPKSRSWPRFRQRGVSSAISLRNAQASRTAVSAGSGISIGSLKNSWTPSPSRNPTVASNRLTRRPIVSWNSPSTRMSSSGSTASTKLVQPRRSAKNIATSRRWLDRIDSSPDETIASCELRGEESLEPPQPFELVDLRRHPLLERPVQLLDRVVIALDPKQRTYSREQLVVVEGLRDEVVGAGLDRLGLLRTEARGQHDHREHGGLFALDGAAGTPRSRPARASRRRAGRGPASRTRRDRAQRARRSPMTTSYPRGARKASSRRAFAGTSSTTRIRARVIAHRRPSQWSLTTATSSTMSTGFET